MINKAVLVSTLDDLKMLDKMNLTMSGVAVVDKISQALEPLVENKVNCLIISDKVIEEQASLTEISKQLEVIFKLYPKQIRVLYYKLGNDRDELVRMLDENSNWDIYYNTEIKTIGNDGLYTALKERQISYGKGVKHNQESVKSSIVARANKYSSLVHSLHAKGVNGREEVNSLIMRDIESVINLNLGYRVIKESLSKSNTELKESKIFSEKLQEIIKDLRNRLQETNDSLSLTEHSRRELFAELTSLQSAHNSLVESLQDIVSVAEINSSLSKTINIDDVRDAPLVIYVKELTTMRYLTTFLNNFVNFSTENLGLTKLLVIENDFNTKSIPLYQHKGISYLTDGTPLESMILGNLVTTGVNNKLLKYLLQNSLQLETLIIYDRTSLTENLVTGKDVINFYTLADLDDKKHFNLEEQLIISNDSRSTYSLGKIKEFASTKGNKDIESSILNSLKLTKQFASFIKNWRTYNINIIEEEVRADVEGKKETNAKEELEPVLQ